MGSDRLRFGEFELDAANFELRRGTERIKLERIPMELLILLARNHGRVVERAEIVEAIWGRNFHLESDSAINTAVRKLRRVLVDDSTRPRYIETVAGKGYRFTASTSDVSAPGDAPTLYSKGLHFWNRKTPESYIEAIRLFQKAIDANSLYAMPYLGLAKSWIMMGIHGLQSPHDLYPRARAALLKTLELDASLAEAHAAMGDVAKGYDWDWVQAETHYLRALTLDPKCSLAHQWYANLLTITGRHDEAIEHAIDAHTLEPLAVGPAGFVGFTYLRARRFPTAVRELQSALTLEPNSPLANWFLGLALAAMGRFPEANGPLVIAVENSHDAPIYLSSLGWMYGAAGDEPRAAEVLERLHKRAAEHYISPYDLALVHAGLGQTDAACEQLEAAEQQRVMRLTELNMPMFDRIREHPRLKAILARMILPRAAELTPSA
jgi:DNA-binding winged helix-turn-helix (wHTH) protein/Flp pilus assembly protein TadD